MFLDRWLAGRSRTGLDRLLQAIVSANGDDFFRKIDIASRQFRSGLKSLEQGLLAVKLINLAIARLEYQRRAVATVARPVGFMIDPANQCQLACPSCSNTANEEFARSFNKWPRGTMEPETFRSFLDAVGLTAFNGHFYNNHEPFLNKSTPDFIRAATDLRVLTFVSSNLSYAKLDIEAIVRSGLRELMVAIDGTTQEVYQRYRKRGRLEWVLANARAIAEMKRKLRSPTPYLRWQMLSFEHNVHQVPDAVRLACDAGFDTFNVATPFPVSRDDPTVTSIEYKGPEDYRNVVFNPRPVAPFATDLESYRDMILSRLNESTEERWRAGAGEDVEPAEPVDRCDWLHLAVISDANGRIVPCCLGDYVNQGTFVFATLGEHGSNLMNSPAYREARLLLANRDVYRERMKDIHPSHRVRCNKCPIRPAPQIGLGAVAAYFDLDADLAASSLDRVKLRSLYGWSKHNGHAPNFKPN